MAPRPSAGLLLHRAGVGGTEVLLVHPGGPFWQKRPWGSWSVPKGEIEDGEEAAAVAEREFAEELGSPAPPGSRVDLGEITQKNGKRVHAWAVEGDLDTSQVVSNTFRIEWPRGSGRQREFPEVDEARWFSLDEARRRIIPGQVPLLERLDEPS
jgi:predicted NUDIX family NTP pyrophosphohydrolase